MRPVHRSLIGLGGFSAATFGVAAVGSAFTYPNVATWYAGLEKPAWTPPGWLFGPVWSALYAMMTAAAWLVWARHGLSGARLAMGLFFVQLGLNAAWSVIFFGIRSPGAALVEIVALWLAILGTILAFRPRSKAAAWLLVPYFAWVSFAVLLNYSLWKLNG